MGSLPIGHASFSDIRSSDFDYVDKTQMISEILDDRNGVYLFTRPRRFGKSLNLSMLDCYFNLEYEGNAWFDGLLVSELRPDDPEKNAYPVIRLDLSCMWLTSEDGFLESIAFEVSRVFRRFKYLLDSDRVDDVMKDDFLRLYRREGTELMLQSSVMFLSDMLYQHHGRKAVILIDEYDSPVNGCDDPKMRRFILSFLKEFMSYTFKRNGFLRLGVITGIMQIAKEGMFSGMNNVNVNDVLSEGFSECYGFTESEVKRLLEIHGHPEMLDTVREHYDGYRFGDTDVYNPWSILLCIQNRFQLRPYWAGNSGEELLKPLMRQEGIYGEMFALMGGGVLEKEIRSKITFAELREDKEVIYSIMAVTGYLRTEHKEGNIYRISLPNREVRGLIKDYLPKDVSAKYSQLGAGLKPALKDGDAELLENTLTEVLDGISSVRILDRESSYQCLLLGILVNLSWIYSVSSETESGDGYCDIMLKSLSPEYPDVVMELKRIDPGSPDDTAEKKALDALEQIRSRRYTVKLAGPADAYGIVFRGKRATVRRARVPYAGPTTV